MSMEYNKCWDVLGRKNKEYSNEKHIINKPICGKIKTDERTKNVGNDSLYA
jgi:hypothetical protein